MQPATSVPRERHDSATSASWSLAGSTDRAGATRLRDSRNCSRRVADRCRRSWCDLKEERPAEQVRDVHTDLIEAWQRTGWNRRIEGVEMNLAQDTRDYKWN